MNRHEYLEDLEKCLASLGDDERESALSYYREYFDEAGEGSEEAVIEKLGAPYQVAGRILEEAGIRERARLREKRAMRPATIALWICASPILIPLAAAGVAIFVALMCVLFSLILVAGILLMVPWIVFIALAAAAIVLGFAAGQLLFLDMATCVYFSGIAMASLGLSLIIYGAFRKSFTAAISFVLEAFKRTGRLFVWPFRRRAV